MIKILILLVTIFSATLVLSPSVAAVDIFTPCSSNAANTDVCKSVQSQNGSGQNPLFKILKTVIDIISLIIGIASVIVIIIAGLQFIISGNDPQSVERSRNMLLYAVVGIVVAVMAQSIVVFVLKNVG